MNLPQPGIFAMGTCFHMHLELDRIPGTGEEELRRRLGAAYRLAVATGLVNVVVGVGPPLAGELVMNITAELPAFPALDGVPATPGDLWIWVHGSSHDAVFDAARHAVSALAPAFTLVREQLCQPYRGNRDLTGFIDGTENPPVPEALEVALVPEDRPGAGGSFVMVQRWIHDLPGFEALSLEDQQRVIGRTKADSIELEGDDRPESSHIGRVVIEREGEELEIFRRSLPFGTLREHGLFFVAFSADPDRFTQMLRRMFGADDGITDALTRFSRPVSGAYYFCPPLAALRELPE